MLLDPHLLDFFDVQLSENYVTWIDSNVNGDNQEQLFLYDGEETNQLTELEPFSDNRIESFEILDNGVLWIGNDSNTSNSANVNTSNRLEVFVATTDEETTTPEETETPDDVDSPPNEDTTTVPNGVYRFFNNETGVHFYTGNEAERDAVLELPNYSFEGASYESVDPLTGNSEPSPVYRFLNQDTGVHLYTISEVERDATQELDNFSFEGEAFFAYSTEVDGSIPIYRFFNTNSGAHFYTPSAAERDNVEDNLLDFQSEGIAYYALPIDE